MRLLTRYLMAAAPTVNELTDPRILVDNAEIVIERIRAAALASSRSPEDVTLVAVSKTKPEEYIKPLYEAGYRRFGENYVQELLEKSVKLPTDIKWHLIGHLQSAKVSKLIRDLPNLEVIETVDSFKLANKLNRACEENGRTLQIYLQVDTSDEDTKSGITPEEVNNLAIEILANCKSLHLAGLMTIGAPNDATCFQKLASCRTSLAQELGWSESQLQLSMGMSGDFETAISYGATSVRVGSLIFGDRIYRK